MKIYFPTRYRFILGFSFALTLFTLGLTLLRLLSLQAEIPLWYHFTRPEQVLTSKWWLLTLPTLSFSYALTNLGLILAQRKIDEFVILTFASFTLINQVILLLALLRIILIL